MKKKYIQRGDIYKKEIHMKKKYKTYTRREDIRKGTYIEKRQI